MHTKTPPSSAFPSKGDILKAVEVALQTQPYIDYLTFSGNGEPTLHPEFLGIVEEIAAMRDLMRPNVKTAIFSNASLLECESTQKALRLIDLSMLKLDAGDEETFQMVDQPVADVHFESIITKLESMKQVDIQSMFLDGEISNCRGKPYENFLKAIQRIKPRAIHIYTTDRQFPELNIVRLTPQKLIALAEDIRIQTGIESTAYWS